MAGPGRHVAGGEAGDGTGGAALASQHTWQGITSEHYSYEVSTVFSTYPYSSSLHTCLGSTSSTCNK